MVRQQLFTFILALRNENKDYLTALTKSANIIKKLVDKSFYLFLKNKTTTEMITFLKDRFQYISPISITRMLTDIFNTKLLDCKDIVDYMS